MGYFTRTPITIGIIAALFAVAFLFQNCAQELPNDIQQDLSSSGGPSFLSINLISAGTYDSYVGSIPIEIQCIAEGEYFYQVVSWALVDDSGSAWPLPSGTSTNEACSGGLATFDVPVSHLDPTEVQAKGLELRATSKAINADGQEEYQAPSEDLAVDLLN